MIKIPSRYKNIGNFILLQTPLKVPVFKVLLVRIQSECEKLRTRKTPNTDPFHPVSKYIKTNTCLY